MGGGKWHKITHHLLAAAGGSLALTDFVFAWKTKGQNF